MTESPDLIEQIEAMRLGINYRLTINVRGFALAVRPLSIGETIQVAQEVAMAMNCLPATTRTPLIEHTLMAKYTLIRASTSEPGKNDLRITDHVLDLFTPDELTLLFKQYVSACDKVNPALETMKEGDIRAMVEALKKSPSEAIERSFLDLVNIVRFLVTNSD